MPRRFQFSLRMLLWLMLCVACFLGGIEFHKAQVRQAEREKFIKMFGEPDFWGVKF